MTDNYEAWRITYQSSEQAARAAFAEMQRLATTVEALQAQLDEQCRLHAIGMERELALITERDRLRAELDSLQQQYDERTACTIVHRGSALACSDAVRVAYYEEYERAKRLDAALRNLLGVCEDSCDFADLQGRGTQREADAMDMAYKATGQENDYV